MRLRLITMATLLLPLACDERPAQPTVSERAGPIGLAEPAPQEEVAPAPEPAPEPEPEPELVEAPVEEQPVPEELVLEQPAPVAPAAAPAPFRPTNAGPVDNIGQAPGNEISDMDAAKGNTISDMDPAGSSISDMNAPRSSIKEIDTAPSDGRDPIAREPAAR